MIINQNNIELWLNQATCILSNYPNLIEFQGIDFEYKLHDALKESAPLLDISNVQKIEHISGKNIPYRHFFV